MSNLYNVNNSVARSNGIGDFVVNANSEDEAIDKIITLLSRSEDNDIPAKHFWTAEVYCKVY